MVRVLRAVAVVLAVAVATALMVEQASAAPVVDGEFSITNGVGTDNDIVEGPDGNMWVTLEGTQGTNGVARITPAGNVTEFPLANTSYGIAVGPDDNLWVSTTIGVIKVPPENPDNPTPYDVGLTDGRGIVAGPDGKMWVAGKDQLVSFGVANPEGTDVSTTIPNLAPHGMSVGSDGLLWIADGNGRVISATAEAVPTITPHDIQITGAGGAQDVAGGPNGQVAYAAPTTDPQSVGRINPGGDPLKTELTNSDPFGVTFAPDGAYWVARSQTNDLLRLTPDGKTTTLTGFEDERRGRAPQDRDGAEQHALGHARHAREGRPRDRRQAGGEEPEHRDRPDARSQARGEGQEGQGEGEVQVLVVSRKGQLRMLAAAEGEEAQVQGLRVPGRLQAAPRQVPVRRPCRLRRQAGQDPGDIHLQGGPEEALVATTRGRAADLGR